MDDPSVTIHRFLLPEEMQMDDDGASNRHPDVCMMHHLSFVGPCATRPRMPSIDCNPPVGTDGVLFDGLMFQRHNPNFLRTFDADTAKVIPRFMGRILSIGVPSKVVFYDQTKGRELSFSAIEAFDLNSLGDDVLSQHQKVLFPPQHGMEYFVDCRRAIRLVTCDWRKLPYEDVRTNIFRRIEVIRLLFDEYVENKHHNDKEAEDNLKREIGDLAWFSTPWTRTMNTQTKSPKSPPKTPTKTWAVRKLPLRDACK